MADGRMGFDKLDQVAAHCQLTVRLSSLHFEANRGGGIIINLLGLYQRENSWDMGVREGGQQDQRHLYPQLFAIKLKLCYRWIAGTRLRQPSPSPSGLHSWRSPYGNSGTGIPIGVIGQDTACAPDCRPPPLYRISDSLWCIGHKS